MAEYCNLCLRLAARTIHLVCALMNLTILILDYFFSFHTYATTKEDKFFLKIKNGSGIGMILSGVALMSLMQKEAATADQRKWTGYHMTKFFMSLLMTPFADKLAIFIIGG